MGFNHLATCSKLNSVRVRTRNVLTLCRMDFIAVLLTAGVKLTNTLFLLVFLQSLRLNVYPKKSKDVCS